MRLLAVLLLLLSAVASAARPPRDPFDLAVERYELPSGMTVLLHRDSTLPQVVVSLWFRVGSRDERPGRTGFAHLYEHLMFMGSQHVPGGAFDRIMEEAGGSNNASTSTDFTFYYDSGPAQLLPVLLWLEAERLTTLPRAMTQDKVDLQREVVRNERRQRYENRPYGQAELLIPSAMYPAGHPYSWPVIGSHADLMAANVDDVKQFFYDFYAPSNATLAVVGDFDPEVARRLIRHYFGWMPSRPRPQAPAAATPTRPVQGQITLTDQVDLGRVYLVWHAPPAGTPAATETRLLADLLGTGQGSRLHRALVYEKQIAQEVKVELEEQALGSLLIAEITAQAGVREDDLLRIAEAELRRLDREAVREEEIQRARNQRLTEWALQVEPLVERSMIIQQMNAVRGDPAALKEEVARLRAVTPAALLSRAAALGLGDPARRLTVRVRPRGAGRAAPGAGEPTGAAPRGAVVAAKPQAAPDMQPPFDLSRQPSGLPRRPFVPPKAARFRVGQLDVLLVQRRGPLMGAQLVVHAGSAAAPAAQAGLAQAVAAMVTEGAADRSATEVAETLERLGARLERRVTPDATVLSLGVMATEWPAAAAILADVAERPRFEPREWQRVQGERIAEVLRQRAEAAYLANTGVLAALYGADHPYGLPPLGTEEGLRALRLEDLKAFHARYWRPRGATLVLAGDVELTQAEATRLAGAFAAWEGSAAPVPAPSQPPQPTRPRLVLLDRPGAPQSELRIANLSQTQRSPDRAAVDVANVLLGGSFTSRLNQNLRERHGWAYDAASQLLRLAHSGVFLVHTAVRSDVTAPAAAEAYGELRRLQAEAVPATELSKGRRSMVQQLLMECERTETLAEVMAEVARYGLPLDHLSRLVRDVQRTDAAALRRAVRGAIQPERATIVVVGDRKLVEAPLRERFAGWEIELR